MNKGSGKGAGVIVAIVIAAFILLAVVTYSQPKADIAHDPNGFLGYSDSFLEWVGDQ